MTAWLALGVTFGLGCFVGAWLRRPRRERRRDPFSVERKQMLAKSGDL